MFDRSKVGGVEKNEAKKWLKITLQRK